MGSTPQQVFLLHLPRFVGSLLIEYICHDEYDKLDGMILTGLCASLQSHGGALSPARAAPALFVLWLPAPTLCASSGISSKLPDSLTQSGVFGCFCAGCSARKEVLIYLALLYTPFILLHRLGSASVSRGASAVAFFSPAPCNNKPCNNKRALQMCRHTPRSPPLPKCPPSRDAKAPYDSVSCNG